ncbi:RrF2 family transcriptional regulator [Desulfuromonas acetexigens]|uniref:Rrf2 family transcriptional regulator n=1 Tax=Trichloromonas acetexigens TaxID=38815 RepID=A0A550JGS5_9BACT|nr:Rrf2 family transcriptional regulator [Desulfuromonas acetexigens]TRO82391.1 Rrf2 family transcriptional regulator [Desulfuromonas acetexigens]
MMGLTRKGEYAIRGMVYLARQEPGKLILVNEIAETVDVPQSFLAKIFQGLTRLGLVRSSRGAGGGFALAKPAAEISLREVIEAVEGPICANRCVIDASFCDRSGDCTVHPVWHRVQNQVRSILDGVSLAELSK